LKPFNDLQNRIPVKTAIDVIEINELIDNQDFAMVFSLLKDKITSNHRFQYNRFQKEFAAGLRGVDLLDYAERLKIFVGLFA
jgi:hypothetical protein